MKRVPPDPSRAAGSPGSPGGASDDAAPRADGTPGQLAPSAAGPLAPYAARILLRPQTASLAAAPFLKALLEGLGSGCAEAGATPIGHLKCVLHTAAGPVFGNLTSVPVGATVREAAATPGRAGMDFREAAATPGRAGAAGVTYGRTSGAGAPSARRPRHPAAPVRVTAAPRQPRVTARRAWSRPAKRRA